MVANGGPRIVGLKSEIPNSKTAMNHFPEIKMDPTGDGARATLAQSAARSSTRPKSERLINSEVSNIAIFI